MNHQNWVPSKFYTQEYVATILYQPFYILIESCTALSFICRQVIVWVPPPLHGGRVWYKHCIPTLFQCPECGPDQSDHNVINCIHCALISTCCTLVSTCSHLNCLHKIVKLHSQHSTRTGLV